MLHSGMGAIAGDEKLPRGLTLVNQENFWSQGKTWGDRIGVIHHNPDRITGLQPKPEGIGFIILYSVLQFSCLIRRLKPLQLKSLPK